MRTVLLFLALAACSTAPAPTVAPAAQPVVAPSSTTPAAATSASATDENQTDSTPRQDCLAGCVDDECRAACARQFSPRAPGQVPEIKVAPK